MNLSAPKRRRHFAPGRRLHAALAALAVLLIAGPVLACRYTVREVGFVDLDNPPYLLYGLHRGGAEGDAFRTAFLAACASLVDANVRSEAVNVEERGDHLAAELMEEGASLPAIVVRSPHGGALTLEVDAEEGDLGQAAWRAVESVVSTPVRERVLDELIEAYAVVLVVEGEEARANERVAEAVAGAMATWEQLRPRLPKPVKIGPRVVTLTRAQASAERVFLWALGLDIENSRDPWAAVMFGRGKLAGEAMEGWLISQTDVYRHLAIVGQDCECSLDRAWLRGKMIPLVWGEDRQVAVVKHVGFDAENPLVQAEMSRILARGPTDQAPVGLPGAGGEDDFFLGYTETTITPPAPAAEVGADEKVADDEPVENRLALAGEGDGAPPGEPRSAAGHETSMIATEVNASAGGALAWSAAALLALVTAGGAIVVLRARRAAA